MKGPRLDDPRFVPAVDLIGRTGADEVRIEFHDDHDGDDVPTVWVALARFGRHWMIGGGLDPLAAVFALADELIDGATCTHCKRPSGVDHSRVPPPLLEGLPVCWYRFDPELVTYRRTCEGVAQ